MNVFKASSAAHDTELTAPWIVSSAFDGGAKTVVMTSMLLICHHNVTRAPRKRVYTDCQQKLQTHQHELMGAAWRCLACRDDRERSAQPLVGRALVDEQAETR